jgi:hypothetical protein
MPKLQPQPHPATHFLTLPNELIYRIISQTRPFGFQNILLVCKHTYDVGKSLIPDHNFCTKWASACDEPGVVRLGTQPVLVLRQLLSAPSKVQEWLLLSIRQFTLSRDWNRLQSYECSQILHRIDSDAPWLSVQLASLSHDYPELEPYLQVYDKKGTEINLGPHHPYFHDGSDDEYYDSDYVYDSSHVTMGPNPTFYHMSTLLALPNLKRLAMSAIPDINWSSKHDIRLYTLQWFINRNHGQRYFQQLEQLKLQDSTGLSMDDIFTLTMLPRLKALRVDGLWHDPEQEDFNSKGSATGRNSSLEHLVLLYVAVPADVIGPFLRSLPSLRTLVWEDHLKEINRWRDEEGNRWDGLEGRVLSFNPRQLVSQLALSHHSTLEHLVLTTETDPEDYIPQQDQIEHFKDFTRLTHLEVDSQLLRSKDDSISDSSLHYRSLTELLPSCIQVVRVNLRKECFQKIFQMLEEIPNQRSRFPTLRQISIRFAEYGTAHETTTSITSLQYKFEAMGIQLEMVEMTKIAMRERLDITMNRNENGRDMRWFFDMTPIVEDSSAY